MSTKNLNLNSIGQILDQLIIMPGARSHPDKAAPDEVKKAYAEGVCGTLALIGYAGDEVDAVVPRLISDRLRHFSKEALAYERETFGEYLTSARPETGSMTVVDFRVLMQNLLPDVLVDTESDDADVEVDIEVEEDIAPEPQPRITQNSNPHGYSHMASVDEDPDEPDDVPLDDGAQYDKAKTPDIIKQMHNQASEDLNLDADVSAEAQAAAARIRRGMGQTPGINLGNNIQSR